MERSVRRGDRDRAARHHRAGAGVAGRVLGTRHRGRGDLHGIPQPRDRRERALFGLIGLVLIALGVVLVARPDVGAVTLAQVFGFFSIVSGIAALVLAAQTRRAAALT
jgi:Short repeat of unknown function (DUF308)